MSFTTTKLIPTALIAAGLLLSGMSASFAAEDSGIYGNWVAERIQGHKLKSKILPTLDIAQDGKTSGSGGCNRYMGGMEIKDNTIKVLPGGSTMMACPPAQMELDSKFHNALNRVTSWKISHGRLVLIDAKDREVLRLKRAPATEAQ